MPINPADVVWDDEQIDASNIVWDDEVQAQPPAPQDLTPEWAGRHPNLYGAIGAATEVARPIAGIGGLMLGTALGTPLGPAGQVTGGGLGYAGGERVIKGADVLLGNKPSESATEAVTNTIKDVGRGAVAEVTGQVVGAGALKGAEKLKPLARKLYESAIKPVPSLPAKVREKVINTGLQRAVEGKSYRPTEKHVYQVEKETKQLIDQADDVVRQAAKQGDAIQTQPLAKAVDDVGTKFSKGPFPTNDLNNLSDLKGDLVASHGQSLPVDKALDMKKQIYKTADKYYGNPNVSIAPAKIEAEKAVARAIKNELESLYPATAPLNKQASELIDFGKVLERAAGRVGNRELFGLFDFLGGTLGGVTGGTGGAVAVGGTTKLLSSPNMKALIAKEISKAAIPMTTKKQLLGQLLRYGTLKAQEGEKQ